MNRSFKYYGNSQHEGCSNEVCVLKDMIWIGSSLTDVQFPNVVFGSMVTQSSLPFTTFKFLDSSLTPVLITPERRYAD